MSHQLGIMHMPNHAPSVTRRVVHRAVKVAHEHAVSSIGITEGTAHLSAFRRRLNYRLRYDKAGGTKRSAGDNPLMTLRGLDVTFATSVAGEACPQDTRYFPERRVQSVTYHQVGVGMVTHIAMHPSVVLHYPTKHTPEWAAEQYDETMRALARAIAAAIKAGHHVVVTGDLNLAKRGEARRTHPYMTPAFVFRVSGMKFKRRGLDWVAWTPGLALKRWIVIPPAQQGKGQDHPWIIAIFKKRAHK